MNITEAIYALRPFTSKVPQEELAFIRANWSEAEPVLLKEIDARLENPTGKHKDALSIYAIHLCAEMKSQEAFGRCLNLCRLHEPVLDELLGDILTGTMPEMLSRTCHGRVDEIKALIEDNSLAEFSRSSAMESLLHMMLDGQLSREELAEYCVSLMREKLERCHSNIWDTVVFVSTGIHADEALPFIKKAYERGLADPGYESLEHILEVFQEPLENVLQRTKKTA